MGGSFSRQKGTSKLQFVQLPGIFGPGPKFEASRRLGGQLEQILGEIRPEERIRGQFESELLTPRFGPETASEQALLKSLTELTGGTAAVRGLGAPTPAALAQTIAPTLINLRQQRLQELAGGVGLDIQRRQQAIQGLLELIGQAAPQTIAGQKQRQRGLQVGLEGGGEALMALLPMLCWVAVELFGEDNPKTYYARYYANTTDNWFIRLYAKYGKRWAKWLKKHSWAKPFVAPIWEVMAILGEAKSGDESWHVQDL